MIHPDEAQSQQTKPVVGKNKTFLFFRRDLVKLVCTDFILPSSFNSKWWKPTLFQITLQRLTFKWTFPLFWCLFTFLFPSSRYGIFLVMAPDGSVAHYSMVFPKYFRFPFMRREDLQIGSLWTEPEFRGQGLATYAVQEILRAENLHTQTYWYVCAEDNLPSVQVANKLGFALYCQGKRKTYLGRSLFAKFQIEERLDTDKSSTEQ